MKRLAPLLLGFLFLNLSFAQGVVVLVEEAIEGAEFLQFSVNNSGYGYAVIGNCAECGPGGLSLSIDPDTIFTVNGQVVTHDQFAPGGNGFTMVFYKKSQRKISRVTRENL